MKYPDAFALAGRLLLAAIFIVSGVGNLFAPAATVGYITAFGLPFPQLAFAGAVMLELAGGALLAVGYKTRLAAAALGAFSVVTALIFHGAIDDQNQFVHLLKNLAIAGGMVYVVAFGAGALSLDARQIPARQIPAPKAAP